jgi:hypothetical protein
MRTVERVTSDALQTFHETSCEKLYIVPRAPLFNNIVDKRLGLLGSILSCVSEGSTNAQTGATVFTNLVCFFKRC